MPITERALAKLVGLARAKPACPDEHLSIAGKARRSDRVSLTKLDIGSRENRRQLEKLFTQGNFVY